MAAKKKAKKKAPTKRSKKVATGRPAAKKKLVKKRAGQPAKKTKKQKARAKTAPEIKSTSRSQAPVSRRVASQRIGSRKSQRALLDSDLQGLSQVESADSESVEELLDEGNSFEAGVVAGVERADDSDGKEVRTREFPEDDVPEEYLDQD
jgi:hypothetical protein